MSFKLINPEALAAPSGYSHGVLAEGGGKLLFVAGQIAWDKNQEIVSDDFVEQFDKALANVITVVEAAGGESNNIVRVVVYVTNKQEYLAQTKAVGERYRKHMGKHYPAMVLVQVARLVDDAAKVEIEAMAVI
jgi:enamine deaminase RidA (YjgF/YER057c/UK114 family)